MAKRVLIANRGEIAIRIARACKELGYTPIGTASQNDTGAHHLKFCAESILIDCEVPSEPYLSVDHLITACKDGKIDMLHPGYGFLSESPLLSKACKKNKILFIGPDAKSLELFGDKEHSKKLAKKHGLPVLESRRVDYRDGKFTPELKSFESELSYPLLIKAVAGGGGRGMRLVRTGDEELEPIFISAAKEAEKFFGDGSLVIEPYLERIKHIEYQIARDSDGVTRAYGERECSAQRNYQKVIEEAPAADLSPTLRDTMSDLSEKLFTDSTYVGLGTVEFLVTEDEKFYFTEVNPRLQVEHPVTEEVHGIDLVKLQIKIVEGEKLNDLSPQEQKDIDKHSIELRVCGESSYDSAPRTGTISYFNKRELLDHFPSLRIESGIESGSIVSHYFDSLLLKMIVTAQTREEAISLTQEVIEKTDLSGVETNLPLLLNILKSKEFTTGTYTTDLIGEIKESYPEKSSYFLAAGIAAVLWRDAPHTGANRTSSSPWRAKDRFRLIPVNTTHRAMTIENLRYEGSITRENDSFHYSFSHEGDTESGEVHDLSFSENSIRFILGKTPYTFSLFRTRRSMSPSQGDTVWLRGEYSILGVELSRPRRKRAQSGESSAEQSILSPLPGKITEVLIVEGQDIGQNEPLFVLESMKMEHKILSSQPGSVDKILIKSGESVSGNQLLATLHKG